MPAFRVSALLATGTDYLQDEAGVTVRPGVAGGLGVEGAWTTGDRYTAGLGLRGTSAQVVIAEENDTRSAGTVRQFDVIVFLERALLARGALRIGGGGAWTRGPSDVVPFRYGNNERFQPTGEIGALVRVVTRGPLFASATWQASRFGGATLGDPIREPGWVNRALVGIRYGR